VSAWLPLPGALSTAGRLTDTSRGNRRWAARRRDAALSTQRSVWPASAPPGWHRRDLSWNFARWTGMPPSALLLSAHEHELPAAATSDRTTIADASVARHVLRDTCGGQKETWRRGNRAAHAVARADMFVGAASRDSGEPAPRSLFIPTTHLTLPRAPACAAWRPLTRMPRCLPLACRSSW